MKKVNEMNGTEKIAWRNIKAGFDYEVGGWYNCIQDNSPEYIPDTEEEAKAIVYECVLTNKYGEGYCGCDKAQREMRFAGEKFIKDCIDYLFETDGDAEELRAEKEW